MAVFVALVGLVLMIIAVLMPAGIGSHVQLDALNLKTNLVIIGCTFFLAGVIRRS